MITRRRFAFSAASACASIAFGEACALATRSADANDGRLTARPRDNAKTTLKSGALGLGGSERDGLIQVPATPPEGKLPLLVFLHGATQSGAGMVRRVG